MGLEGFGVEASGLSISGRSVEALDQDQEPAHPVTDRVMESFR